jgi:hypothetical protein
MFITTGMNSKTLDVSHHLPDTSATNHHDVIPGVHTHDQGLLDHPHAAADHQDVTPSLNARFSSKNRLASQESSQQEDSSPPLSMLKSKD